MLYLALVLAFSLPACSLASAEETFRSITFEQAQTAALQEKKIVLIDFFTTWCVPCKKLDETTWKDEAVGKYRAAVDTRNRLNPDFVIIARTDAFGAVGGSLEEAIKRGRAYADAGVDLVWPELSSPDRQPAEASWGAEGTFSIGLAPAQLQG